uniref:Putative secreted protein n=1 Tax=Ixodes ricinus TaxID=34613 RepID=A0A147BUM0_IXORI
MADSVAWSPWSRRPTNVYFLFFFTCSSRASRLQAARKKVLETDHDEQERWIRKHPRQAETATKFGR